MKIALLSSHQKWSVYSIWCDLKKYLERGGFEVDVITNRGISRSLLKYDRIVTFFRWWRDYNNRFFKEELNHKTWIFAAGPAFKRIEDWSVFDHVIVISKFAAAHLPKNTNYVVCQPGVDTELFKPMDVAKKWDVGFVGNRTSKRKRFSLIKQVCQPLKFFHQDGWNDTRVSRETLCKLYNEMRCYISLSTFEGGCNPLLEAGACGLPVISTNVGYAPEIKGIIKVDMNSDITELRNLIKSVSPRDGEILRYEIQDKWSWEARLPQWMEVLKL